MLDVGWFASRKNTVTGLGTLTALAAALVWVAPVERTLGSGMKSVYVHVALTWAGMTGMVLAGLAGLVLLIRNQGRLHGWLQVVAWTGFGFYVAGFMASMLASEINWGGIPLYEPRNVAALQVIALGLIVQVLNAWPVDFRVQGGLNLALAAYMLWSNLRAELVLHPRDPIRPSPSLGIQLSFLALYVLALLAATWIVLHWQQRRAAT